MFKSEKQQLKSLVEERRRTVPLSPERSQLVSVYNEILDSMVDRGLSEPLPDDLLLDQTLLSAKYSSMEEQWEAEHHITFEQFVEKCSYVYVVEVKEVRSHAVLASVIRDYKDQRPWWQRWSHTVEIKYYIPWGFNKWYTEGERSLVFLDKDMISQGILGRMPLVGREGVWFAASYHRDSHFWPSDVETVQSELGDAMVYLIELQTIEKIIRGQTRDKAVGHQAPALTHASEQAQHLHDQGDELRGAVEFVERNKTRMERISIEELKDKGCVDPEGHAEDVASEVSLSLMMTWASLRSPENAMYVFTVNRARTHARACQREIAVDIEEQQIPFFSQSSRDPAEMIEKMEFITWVLSSLDEREATVLQLRFIHDMSFAAIAERLQEPVGAITSAYVRILKKLRKSIEAREATSAVNRRATAPES
ncbi:MAG TPA: sigma-70 family RNA polymerase sigma factor [Pyrinomonadaceae bacterium]|jgi:RNA polymerase sigma factor (sigma-70 family)